MAAYDAEQQKIVVRVVYDGPGRAGKTTNLRELCRFFAVERRSDVYTPAEDQGRTLYFDWLQLECGFVAGRALRCQLVSVPGQQEYALRRSQLLRSADAVVFVCESTPEEVRSAGRGFAMMREYLARGGRADVPIVVQANKQDLPGALSLSEVVAELDARSLAGSVAARAAQGEGVREALVLAVRGVTTQLQRLVSARGTGGLDGELATPETLYRELREVERRELELRGAPSRASYVAIPAAPSPAQAVEEPPVPTEPEEPVDAAPPPEPARRKTLRHLEATLPDAALPVGCVWPPMTGRSVLRALGEQPAMHRGDFAVAAGSENDKSLAPVVYDAGRFRLRTTRRFRYDDLELGRAALRRHAQRRQQLGAMLAPDSVLALQRDGGDEGESWWLWAVAPRRTTLQAVIVRASGRHDEGALGEALSRFAAAATESASLAQWHGLELDLHPSNFGLVDDGSVAYLDEFMEDAQADADLATVLLQRVDEHGRWPGATGEYLASVERAAVRAVGNGLDLARFVRSLETAVTHSPEAAAARGRLLDTLTATLGVEGETG